MHFRKSLEYTDIIIFTVTKAVNFISSSIWICIRIFTLQHDTYFISLFYFMIRIQRQLKAYAHIN